MCQGVCVLLNRVQLSALCHPTALAVDARNVHFLSPPVVLMPCTLQNGASPLYIASQNGHTDVAQLLLDRGAGVNIADKVRASFVSTVRCTLAVEQSCGYEVHWDPV
jgi:ankyrin repeat protein